MPFFALQVRARVEERFLKHARVGAADVSGRLIYLRRKLRIKRAGRWRDETAPLFAGYIFLKDDAVTPDTIVALRGLPGFIRFLPSNDRIQPLDARDEALVRHFLPFGDVLDKSIVQFDENKRIRVVSGPLKGLDGQIVKVDRRKHRARVRLELYKEAFEIDFGFEAIEPSAAPGSEPAAAPGEAAAEDKA
jgi:transcription termination/antitermination protein NusG